MRKLLSADFILLLRSKIFWATFVVMLAGTIMLNLSFHNTMQLHGYIASDWTAEGAIFCMMPGIGTINALWLHFVIGSDYDQGTLRNKITAGHTRGAIFLSHWLTACTGALMNLAVSLVVGTVLSTHFFQDFALDTKGLCWLYLCCALLTLSYAAICIALAMNLGSKAISIVTGMFVIMGLSIVSSLIDSKVTDITIRGVFVDPLIEKLIFFFHDFLPSGQCVQINNLLFDRMGIWPLYSLALTAIVTTIGYLLFRRKDMR